MPKFSGIKYTYLAPSKQTDFFTDLNQKAPKNHILNKAIPKSIRMHGIIITKNAVPIITSLSTSGTSTCSNRSLNSSSISGVDSLILLNIFGLFKKRKFFTAVHFLRGKTWPPSLEYQKDNFRFRQSSFLQSGKQQSDPVQFRGVQV